jgi:hypothetical protein
MTVEAISPLSRPAPRLSGDLVPPAILLGALILYVLVREASLVIAGGPASGCLATDVAGVLLAAGFAGITYRNIPAVLRPLLRGIAAVVLIQIVFDGTTLIYGPASMLNGSAGGFFVYGTIIGIATGLAALWRPGFAVPLFFHYVAFRHQLNLTSGVAVSETDYLSMLDVGQFVAVGGLFLAVASRPRVAGRLLPSWIDLDTLRSRTAILIFIWAVGAHFGNYFISGWTKIQAGGDQPLFWLLHNPTQTSILIGLERGDNWLAAWPSLVEFSWNAISGAGVWLNLFVLGAQILAPLGLMHRRALMVFTVLFDIFHIAVMGTLGAFFFFWIAVNILVYLSATRIPDKAITNQVRAVGLVAVLAAHFVFYTSHLGWLDAAQLASPSLYAETRDGRTVPVPSVYWGIMSYSIAQTAMYIPEDHFPMRLGGNTYNRADWATAQACSSAALHEQSTGVSMDTVRDMVREHDAAVRLNPAVKNDNLYYFYPHHMVANPMMFADFNALKIDDIVGYRYRVDSVCLSLKDGRLVRDVRKSSEFKIDVRG